MNISKYPHRLRSVETEYEFDSYGPMGTIKKVVQYGMINLFGRTVVNLCFGDWDKDTCRINDFVVSNNKDKDMIMATVATTCVEFTSLYPNLEVFAAGSTPARTRLYQMGILANWKEIEAVFKVRGYRNGRWEAFQPNTPYDAFMVLRKTI